MTRSATPLARTNQTSGFALQWLDFRAKQKDRRAVPLSSCDFRGTSQSSSMGRQATPLKRLETAEKRVGFENSIRPNQPAAPATTIMGRSYDRPMRSLNQTRDFTEIHPNADHRVPPVH